MKIERPQKDKNAFINRCWKLFAFGVGVVARSVHAMIAM